MQDPKDNSKTIVLDAETTARYVLIIEVTDQGKPSERTSFVSVQVDVADTNDNAPIFEASAYAKQVDETIQANTDVLRVRASDKDPGVNGQIKYSLTSGNDAKAFALNETTGVLSVVTGMCSKTADKFVFKITAADLGNPSKSSTATATVAIKAVNVAAPKFDPASAKYENADVRENSKIGDVIATVKSTDADCGGRDTVSYKITDNPDDVFQIDAKTGVVKLAKTLNRESREKYTALIEAKDDFAASPRSSLAVLKMTVTDVIDSAPVMDPSTYTVNLAETPSTGIKVAKLLITDTDLNDVQTFSITSGDTGFLAIDSKTGQITTKKELCYPTVKKLEIQVAVVDKAGLKDTGSVTVNIRNANTASPVFSATQFLKTEIKENSDVGDVVAIVTAKDKDCGDAATLRYRITAGDTVSPRFEIDSEKGIIKTKAKFDRELVAAVNLTVEAVDNSAPASRTGSTYVAFTIGDANDHYPKFKEDEIAVDLEEGTDTGRLVATVSVSDDDATKPNNEFAIDMIAGNTDSYFKLDGTTGKITVVKELCQADTPKFELLLRTRDKGAQYKETFSKIKITVKDVNKFAPDIDKVLVKVTLKEDTKKDTLVHTIKATDKDCKDTAKIRFAILDIDGVKVDSDGLFLVDATTGKVTLNGTLDRETRGYHTITVAASDGTGDAARASTAKIEITVSDLNDVSPVLAEHAISAELSEATKSGTLVARLQAIDLDATGPNNKYSFYKVDGDNSKWKSFKLDESTGNIFTQGDLDFDTAPQKYTLEFKVRDKGTPALEDKDAAKLVVTLIDVNDNSPKITVGSHKKEIPEDFDIGGQISKLSATDADATKNAELAFSIKDANGVFELKEGGLVVTKAKFDREKKDAYTFVISVTDKGDSPRVTEVTLAVNITDVNDLPPVMDADKYVGKVAENTADGEIGVTVSATDNDLGENAKSGFTVVTVGAPFNIDKATGKITTSKKLDRETKDAYTFTVRATNINNAELYDEAVVTVGVSDLNDNTPAFKNNQLEYAIKLKESVKVKTRLLTFSGTDGDLKATENTRLHFKLTTGNDDAMFALSDDGNLTLAQTLDFEKKRAYKLSLDLFDDGNPRLKQTATVSVIVANENDDSPEFTKDAYTADALLESAPKSTDVITVKATDKDGEGSTIKYTMVDGQWLTH